MQPKVVKKQVSAAPKAAASSGFDLKKARCLQTFFSARLLASLFATPDTPSNRYQTMQGTISIRCASRILFLMQSKSCSHSHHRPPPRSSSCSFQSSSSPWPFSCSFKTSPSNRSNCSSRDAGPSGQLTSTPFFGQLIAFQFFMKMRSATSPSAYCNKPPQPFSSPIFLCCR